MTKRMLLLVSTAVLLVIAAVAIPAPRDAEPGLNIIFDMVKKYNQSIAKVRTETFFLLLTCYSCKITSVYYL